MLAESPSLKAALRLKCPYCRRESLLRKGSWFNFQEACPTCHYRYSREIGYFSGAPWMISYPASSLLALSVGFYLYSQAQRLPTFQIVAIICAVGAGVGLFTYPFAKSLWLYFDHKLHPLEASDFQKP